MNVFLKQFREFPYQENTNDALVHQYKEVKILPSSLKLKGQLGRTNKVIISPLDKKFVELPIVFYAHKQLRMKNYILPSKFQKHFLPYSAYFRCHYDRTAKSSTEFLT